MPEGRLSPVAKTPHSTSVISEYSASGSSRDASSMMSVDVVVVSSVLTHKTRFAPALAMYRMPFDLSITMCPGTP